MSENVWKRLGPVCAVFVFGVLLIGLAVTSYRGKSGTWDEPQHLTAGYAALTEGDYRIDPEHPPFVRMWAALPLLGKGGVVLNPDEIGGTAPGAWVGGEQFFFCHDFVYTANDAEDVLFPARFMIVLLAVILGALVFVWVRAWYGWPPAVAALALFLLEPNLLAHSRLVTTDLGFTVFAFGALFFLWRTSQRSSWQNVTGLAIFFALAHISKFSAVLLWPVVFVFVAIGAVPSSEVLSRVGKPWARRRWLAGLVLVVLVVSATWFTIWASYGFRYDPSSESGWRYRLHEDPTVVERVPTLARVVAWVDGRHLLPNAYSQGFLRGQFKAAKRSAYLAGKYSEEGWWYFFPVAFLIKTPLALLLLMFGGIYLSVRHRGTLLRKEIFVFLPMLVFLAGAMTAKLNIGTRHILILFPLAIVVGSRSVEALLSSGRRVARYVLAALGLLLVLEGAGVYPHYLTFFNALVGGPRHGKSYLVDSNLDWGQDLKGLQRWMEAEGVNHVNLSYFGTADPSYYGVNCTHLPGAPFFAQRQIVAPALPGYVAISATNLIGPYFNERGREFFRPLLEREPDHVIGNSIHVYWVEEPWWQRP